jgi:hypothetical protein
MRRRRRSRLRHIPQDLDGTPPESPQGARSLLIPSPSPSLATSPFLQSIARKPFAHNGMLSRRWGRRGA